MEERRLGGTELRISRVVLGCGNFGGVGSAPELFGHGENEAEAFALMDAARGLGINVFDTADAYGGGRSETFIGNWLRERGRDGVLVSSKVFHSVVGDPDDRGLARERILRQIDGTLERFGVERLDMYLIHEPDPDTPLEETLGALAEVVQAGKVRSIGASNIDAAYLREALELSRRNGWPRFEWVQNEYSLLERSAEHELLELCAAEGLGFTAFSPLAGGWLTGKYRRDVPYPKGSRMTQRPGPYGVFENDLTFDALERFEQAAAARDVEPAVLAFAWVLSNPHVTAAIAGPRRPEHLEPPRAGLELELTPDERDELAGLFT
ncbi:MAG: aldo/keto reductase [Actinomycetota bacterium]|nr:aldo/keto reductase [Actinomycetota bacterium]